MRDKLYRIVKRFGSGDWLLKRIDRFRWMKEKGIYSATYEVKNGIEIWHIDLHKDQGE